MAHNGDDALQRRIRAMRGPPAHKTTRTGIVKGVREHYSNKDLASIELEDEQAPPRRKRAKGSPTAVADDTYRRSFNVEVPKAHTKGMAIGDRVHVHTSIERAR
jgi:hypothetical protein